jgi:hypothetical protein
MYLLENDLKVAANDDDPLITIKISPALARIRSKSMNGAKGWVGWATAHPQI